MIKVRHIMVAGVLFSALSACAPGSEAVSRDATGPFSPEYLGIETRLLDRDYESDDLVGFIVEMRGARDRQDVADYAECAAARYALIRGYGFARHLRTNVEIESGVWRGDAVYSISAALPQGLRTIDAEVVAATCAQTEIPTV